jgi:hypothetical protein
MMITINVLFRPKLDDEVQSVYEECLNSEVIKFKVDQILRDTNSFINKVSINIGNFLFLNNIIF